MRTALLITLCAAAPALAQQYRITDLGALTTNGEGAGCAINQSGQVAGSMQTDSARRFNHAVRISGPTITDLGLVDPSTGLRSYGWGINDLGHVVGTGERPTNRVPVAFVNRGSGNVQLPGFSSIMASNAFAINNSGQIAGAAATGQTFMDYAIVHAVIWTNNVVRDIGTLGGRSSHAWSINNLGNAVGGSLRNNAAMHAFIFRNNLMTDLGTLGGPASEARDINDSDQVVGWAHTPGNVMHAFLWQGSTITDLGSLGTTSDAYSISNSGTIVGTYWRAGAGPRAFVRQPGGAMVDLNDRVSAPGWTLQYARAVNDAGQITGIGRLNGRGRAFLLTLGSCTSDFNGDGDYGTDSDIEAFFACLGGTCCPNCGSADFNGDGEYGSDADIESFFRVLAGQAC
jgi:probable HAF family extracellular repeat protein